VVTMALCGTALAFSGRMVPTSQRGCGATIHRPKGEWHMDVGRFLGLDAYEWFVTVLGSALIGLALWMM
jgi:hypothetical protein